jgi:hypothetical protein
MATNPIPIPVEDPISVPRKAFSGSTLKQVIDYLERQESGGFVGDRWAEWLNATGADIAASTRRVSTAGPFADQGASISATDIGGGILAAGWYEFLWWATVVRAATTSSSLIVTLDHIYRGQVKSFASPAMTGNTAATQQSGGGLIFMDGATAIRYAVTYASVGGTSMLYDFTAVLVRVNG